MKLNRPDVPTGGRTDEGGQAAALRLSESPVESAKGRCLAQLWHS